MKTTVRFLATVLVLLLVAAPMTAFADTLGENGNRDINVEAKYVDGIRTPDVYSIDVTWGAMQFTYTNSGVREWDPSNHQYADTLTPGWTANGNSVTVTNHSNVAVDVTFSYKKATGFDGISGEFSVTSKNLKAGEVGNVAGADSVTTELALSGALASTVTDFTKIGSVTVSLR